MKNKQDYEIITFALANLYTTNFIGIETFVKPKQKMRELGTGAIAGRDNIFLLSIVDLIQLSTHRSIHIYYSSNETHLKLILTPCHQSPLHIHQNSYCLQ